MSALIHAATMVTAGVYLIVRSNPIFNARRPTAQLAVTVVGTVTLLFGAIIGVRQGRHQEGARRVHDVADRLHDAGRGPRPGRVRVRDRAPARARVLQGGALPRRRLGDARHGRRGEHAALWRPAHASCRSPSVDVRPSATWRSSASRRSPGSSPRTASSTRPGIKGGTAGWLLARRAIIGAGITAFYMTRVMLMTWSAKRWKEEACSAGPGAPAYTEPHIPHPHESPAVMTVPMILLAIGSVGAGAFLIVNDRLADFLAPVVGTPPVLHGIWTVARRSSPWSLAVVRRRARLGHVRAGAGARHRAARATVRHERGAGRTCTATRSTSRC